jgi:hypothetical protein
MNLNPHKKVGLWLVILIILGAVVALLNHGPIPQPLSYHEFADKSVIWGIPNFLDVLSNIPFVLVGLLGLYKTFRHNKIHIITENRASYNVFFIGVALVGVGSGYYHLSPSNATLVWDRLPMTIAFMALSSIIIEEFTSIRLGKKLLVPLVSFGVLSVLYWHWTETAGHGDLRPYMLVQFLPMLVIPVILLFFNAAFTRVSGYWLLLSAYVIAKLFEHFDGEMLAATRFVSGHSLKHVVAAIGIYILLRALVHRRCTPK